MGDQRNTNQLKITYNAVLNRCDHPTADQIYEEIRKKNPNVSKGTVYRNLNKLVENGKIKEVKAEGADRFDRTIDDHYHIQCIKCGKVIDAPMDFLPFDNNKLESKTNYVIEGYEVTFRGICPECQNE